MDCINFHSVRSDSLRMSADTIEVNTFTSLRMYDLQELRKKIIKIDIIRMTTATVVGVKLRTYTKSNGKSLRSKKNDRERG